MDKYDREIALLKRRPKLIPRRWGRSDGHGRALSPLFRHLTPTSRVAYQPETNLQYGCPTQIADNLDTIAWDDRLTQRIRRYKHFPCYVSAIRVKDLPRFATLQRLADRWFRNRRTRNAIRSSSAA